jgi:iron(III) transport system permease protein
MVALGENGLTLFLKDSLGGLWLSLLFSPVGVAAIQLLAYWPIPALFGLWSLRRIDPDILEQVRLEGGRTGHLFLLLMRLIAVPLSQAGLMVAVLSLNDMGTAEMLRVITFPILLYSELNLLRDVTALASISWPLLLFLAFAGLCWKAFRRLFRIESNPSPDPAMADKHLSLFWAVACVAVLLGVGPGLVICTEVNAALSDSSTIHGELLFECVKATIETGLGAVALAGAGCALLAAWKPGKVVGGALEAGLFLLFAFPSPLLALGFLRLTANCPAWLMGWTDTFWILSAACSLRFLWGAWAILRAGEEEIPENLKDQIRLEGIGRWRSLVGIHFPLLKGHWLAAMLLVWAFTIGEVSLCRILQPPGVQTLAARTVNFMHWGHDGMVASGLLLVAVLEVLPFGVACCSYKPSQKRLNLRR